MAKNINIPLVSALRRAVKAFCRYHAYSMVVLTCLILGAQIAWAQSPVTSDAPTAAAKASSLAPVMPVEDRLPYLRKLKAFLEEDPLDMAEFERQFDLKLGCRPWRTTGKICEYRTHGERWPYAEFSDQSPAIRYIMFGDGTEDSLWINLLYPGQKHAYNCITGTMLQRIFTPPEWPAAVDTATTRIPNPHPSRALVLALRGHDRQERRIDIVTMGVAECTGKLQISIYPRQP